MMTDNPKLAQAENNYLAGDYYTAKEIYISVVADSPTPFIFQRIAQCHYALKEYDDAMAVCAKAIDLDPDSASAYVVLSKIHYQQGDILRAEKQAQKAISLDDMVAGAYVVLAGIEIAKGNHSTAVEYAQKAAELEPGAWDSHYFLGIALGSGIDLRKATEELKKAYKLNPSKELRFAILYHQYISRNRTWISIILVALMLGGLILGNLIITVIVSIVYFVFGILNLIWRKKLTGILSICVGFVFLGLYALFW